jgi:hypothetical protein
MDLNDDVWLIDLLTCSSRLDFTSLEEALFPKTIFIYMTISYISHSGGLRQP